MYVVIVGCGSVGSELSKILAGEGHNVVMIDRNPLSFERLGRSFNGFTIVGSGFDCELLKSSGIEKAEVFCAVTNSDNTNIIAAQVAKRLFKIPKVITRVYDPKRAELYRALGLDIISGTSLVAAMIRDKIIESKFTSYLIETGELGVLEIKADESLEGEVISRINIAGELIVTAVRRLKGVILPEPQTKIEKGDILLAVVKTTSLDKVRKRFGI